MANRIQRKRVRGWRMPPHAVYIGRPSKWGNPFEIYYDPSKRLWRIGKEEYSHRLLAQKRAVDLFRGWLLSCERDALAMRASLEEIRGCDLACWCAEGTPCHGDVLIEFANEGVDHGQ